MGRGETMICNTITRTPARVLPSLKYFSQRGGKFRVTVVNRCNFNCFFCHNEGMDNPREPGKPGFPAKGCQNVETEQLLELINTYTRLGGKSLNITGGEPTTRKDITDLLMGIDKRDTTIVLNSNVSSPFVDRLLNVPKIPQVDAIFASLHTTDNEDFGSAMGTPGDKKGATSVMNNMERLRDHGYHVEINFSLGNYNKYEWEKVLEFGTKAGIATKAITLIRHDESDQFYQEKGTFIDPRFVENTLEKAGCKLVKTDPTKVGGYTDYYETDQGVSVIIKNISRGRLRTDMCNTCTLRDQCGEGVYALRSGIDGIWKPCLLNKDTYSAYKNTDERSYEDQILDEIHKMVGAPESWEFQEGKPY